MKSPRRYVAGSAGILSILPLFPHRSPRDVFRMEKSGSPWTIGSLAWSRRRGGRLTALERWRFLAAMAASRLRSGRGPLAAGRLEMDALELPDSSLVRRTLALAEEAYAPWLLHHCLRTFLWGGLIGQAERVSFDAEALAVAALLHDLGLVQPVPHVPPADCFAVRGARYARDWLERGAAPAPLVSSVSEAICMHLNVRVRASAGAVPYLLHRGAALDVIGRGGASVAPVSHRVLERYPRGDFARHLARTLRAEAGRHGGTRLALLVRRGFLLLVRSAFSGELSREREATLSGDGT